MVTIKKAAPATPVRVALPTADDGPKIKAPKKLPRPKVPLKAKIEAKTSAPVSPSTLVGKGGLKGRFRCLCGCNGKTNNTFLRGHVQRVRGWLLRIKAGEGLPKAVGMPAELARALGPWKKSRTGLVPSKDYSKLIRE